MNLMRILRVSTKSINLSPLPKIPRANFNSIKILRNKQKWDKLTEDALNEDEKEEEKKEGSGFTYFALALGVFSSYAYLGWGDDMLENESAFAAHNRRAWDSVRESYEYFMYPPKKSLLPPLPKHMHKDLTICVELTDTLTHMVWDKDVGWRVAIRPGAKEFLYGLHSFYEVVLFTDTPGHLAEPVVAALDKVGFFLYRLYREHHRLEKGTHLKDLDYLNRDLSSVIVLETDMRRLQTHPENGLQVKEWLGTSGDQELYKLGKVLQEIAIWSGANKIKDLRPILDEIKKYDSKDIFDGWAKYKSILKEAENVTAVPERNYSIYSSIASQTTSILSSLVGGGLNRKESYGPANTVEQLERTSDLVTSKLKSDFKRLLVQEKQLVEERRKAIEAHKEKLQKSDLTLLDYLMGNAPQPESD